MSFSISYISEFVAFIELDWILILGQGALWASNGFQLKAPSNWRGTFRAPLPKNLTHFEKWAETQYVYPYIVK